MKKISFLLFSLFILASCTQDLVESPTPPVNGKEVIVPFSFTIAPMQTKVMGSKGVSTKSVVPTSVDESAFVDMWVVQFDKDGNFVKKVYNPAVSSTAFDAPLVATPTSQVSHLYFLANIGPTLLSPDTETTFLTQIKSITSESDLFVVSGGKKCIPMFAKNLTAVIPYTGFIDKIDVTMTRMLARVQLTCNVDAALSLNIESARVCNVPMGIQFCPPATATTTATSTTKVTNFPIESVTLTDNSFVLVYYLPDNQKGVGTNTTGGERFKAGTTDATYIEIIGRTTGANGGDEVGYSIYPGSDITNDYNIVRNTKYEITTTLKDVSSSDQRVKSHERPNCYIIAPGGSIKIPAKHANDSPEIGIQIPDVTGTWTPSVYWQTSAGLVTVARTAGDGFFTVTAPSASVEGNALVAVKDGSGNVLWSWHIWVMAADVNYPTNQFATNGFTFMDRNIGATDPGLYGATYCLNYGTSGGFVYEWGRKDPFTLGNSATGASIVPTLLFNAAGTAFLPNATIYTPATLGATQCNTNDPYTYLLDVASAGVGYDKALAYSIKYPALYLKNWVGSTTIGSGTTVSLNATNGSDAWGGEFGQPKSVYDPCPEGWRVPSYKKTSTSLLASMFGGSQGNTNAITASVTAYNYITVGTSAMLFPFCGYREAATGVVSAVGAYGFFWGATAVASSRNSYGSYLANSPTYNQQYTDDRSRCFSVRCVKNW